jgi:hypothetical protein
MRKFPIRLLTSAATVAMVLRLPRENVFLRPVLKILLLT